MYLRVRTTWATYDTPPHFQNDAVMTEVEKKTGGRPCRCRDKEPKVKPRCFGVERTAALRRAVK